MSSYDRRQKEVYLQAFLQQMPPAEALGSVHLQLEEHVYCL